MASTKVNFYLAVATVILIAFISIMFFGNQLKSYDKITLDDDSEEYITDFQNQMNDAEFLNTYNATKSVEAENPFLTRLSNIPVIGEILGVVTLLIEATSTGWDFLVVIYNLPSFILGTLGGNLEDWSHVVNIFSYAILIGLIIVFARLVR